MVENHRSGGSHNVVDLEKIALVKIVARLKDDGGQEDEEEHCGGKGFHLK